MAETLIDQALKSTLPARLRACAALDDKARICRECSDAAARIEELEHKLATAQKEARAFYALSEERMCIIEATRSQLATARQDEREECAREVKGYFMRINGTEYHADDRLRALEGQT